MRISPNNPVNRDFVNFSVPQINKRINAFQSNDTLLSLVPPRNCIAHLIEQLKNVWNWILSYFSTPVSSTVQPQSDSLSTDAAVLGKINFGRNFIARCLQDNEVQAMLNSSCRVAIIARLNQQVVSRHCTVMCLPALDISRQLAFDLLTLNLNHYAQDHSVRSLDAFRIEAFFLKQNPNGTFDVRHQFQAEYETGMSGREHCPGLSRVDAMQYFSTFGIESPHGDNLFRFMFTNA